MLKKIFNELSGNFSLKNNCCIANLTFFTSNSFVYNLMLELFKKFVQDQNNAAIDENATNLISFLHVCTLQNKDAKVEATFIFSKFNKMPMETTIGATI